MFSNLTNMEMLIIKLLLVSRQLNYIINYHIDRGGNQSSRQALFEYPRIQKKFRKHKGQLLYHMISNIYIKRTSYLINFRATFYSSVMEYLYIYIERERESIFE